MSLNQLERTRALELPSREAMLNRDLSVQQFWDNNKNLLSDAWAEWESETEKQLPLNSSLLDENLHKAVMEAWKDPSKELAVKELLQEVAPGVYQLQLFNPERLAVLREYLENTWNAQIPLRPPYGIALNRRGAMLDKRSEGFLAAPSFQAFYKELTDTYMRPISRLIFPEIIGNDTQTFGFSIFYQPNTDTSLRPHTDASAVTMNVNLNLPGEEFTGSGVDFFDYANGKTTEITFKPGVAMLHRGSVPHAAKPILSGERTNFVLWLFGERGRLPSSSAQRVEIDAKERWTTPNVKQDEYAPF